MEQFESSDELFNDISRQHEVIVSQIMYQRQANLRKVLRWWSSGNFNSSVNTILQLKDASINKDFLDMTFGTAEPENE